MTDSGLIWAIVVFGGVIANGVWRLAGVVLSRGVDPDSQLMVWVRDVSTTLVAALVARMLLMPSGALAEIPATVRFVAFASGLLAFYARGSLLIGVVVAEGVFFAVRSGLM